MCGGARARLTSYALALARLARIRKRKIVRLKSALNYRLPRQEGILRRGDTAWPSEHGRRRSRRLLKGFGDALGQKEKRTPLGVRPCSALRLVRLAVRLIGPNKAQPISSRPLSGISGGRKCVDAESAYDPRGADSVETRAHSQSSTLASLLINCSPIGSEPRSGLCSNWIASYVSSIASPSNSSTSKRLPSERWNKAASNMMRISSSNGVFFTVLIFPDSFSFIGCFICSGCVVRRERYARKCTRSRGAGRRRRRRRGEGFSWNRLAAKRTG